MNNHKWHYVDERGNILASGNSPSECRAKLEGRHYRDSLQPFERECSDALAPIEVNPMLNGYWGKGEY